MTLRAAGVAGTAVGATCAGIAYATACWSGGASHLAPWFMLAAISISMGSALLLGAGRASRHPLLAAAAAFLALSLAAVLGAALLLPAEAAGEPLLFGLPRRLGLVVVGIGLLPFLVLPAAFARDFTDDGLDPDALAALRAKAAALRGEST